jgi:hypothetical protein
MPLTAHGRPLAKSRQQVRGETWERYFKLSQAYVELSQRYSHPDIGSAVRQTTELHNILEEIFNLKIEMRRFST